MNHTLTYSDGRAWGRLTTERAESSDNMPVLVVAGIAYGPADIVAGLPHDDIFGETTAASLVANWATASRTEDERNAADRFCSQWIDGPQVRGLIALNKETIGAWDFAAAQVANEIAAEHFDSENFIEGQARALKIMGGELLPWHTWADWDTACAEAADHAD